MTTAAADVSANDRSSRSATILDGAILFLVAAFTLLRGCREVADNDLWWHLRAGQWILDEGRIPFSDPFSFGSADRLWIDLHWGFQVVLALVYRWQGVSGTVLFAATTAMLAVVCCWLPCWRRMPLAICAACWLPSIWLIASRVGPRPEVFSMLFLAAYLAVLHGAKGSPRWLWLLPGVQWMWVNFHGLFILGPIVLGAYLTDATWNIAARRWRRQAISAEDRRDMRRLLAVFVATCAACLANPYFVDGALLPFELLPKVTSSGNLYKEAIKEFASPARYLATSRPSGPLGEWNLHAEFFLLLALPLSFFLPAVWSASQATAHRGRRPGRSHEFQSDWPSNKTQWSAAVAALAIVLAAAAALPARGAPAWLAAIADAAPAAMLLLSALAGYVLSKRSRPAAQLAVCAGAAMTLWLVWAPELLFGRDYASSAGAALSPVLPPLTLFAAIPATVLSLRNGGHLFRLLIAAAFAYLSLQAVRNMALFGLVGGAVLAWNFGEWGAALRSRVAGESGGLARWAVRGAAIGALALALLALVTDRLYRWSGQPELHVAVGEMPFAAPHDAAKFAGQEDLPRGALAYDLGLASVYLFHNSPESKPYIDPRLELPDVETFDNYLLIDERLNACDPRWRPLVRRLGDPLVMMNHQEHFAAEAELYRQPDWCCVYYDALASIFVPRQATLRPNVDFAQLHFDQPSAPSTPDLPGAAFREGVALSNLGATLRRITGNEHPERLAMALRALDRLQMAVAEAPGDAKAWTVLGDGYRNLIHPGGPSPPAASAGWRVDPDLFWAQATRCYVRALEIDSENAAWERLYDSFRARRMFDDRGIGNQGTRLIESPEERAAEIERLRDFFSPLLGLDFRTERPENFDAIAWLLQNSRPDAAIRGPQEREPGQKPNWEWPWAERIATAWMHLGHPAQARRIWQAALHPPSETERLCRIAASHAASGDWQEALQLYLRAARLAPESAEPFLGLAVLHFEAGQAASARDACQRALQKSLSDYEREHLQSFARLLEPRNRDPASRD